MKLTMTLSESLFVVYDYDKHELHIKFNTPLAPTAVVLDDKEKDLLSAFLGTIEKH